MKTVSRYKNMAAYIVVATKSIVLILEPLHAFA
jgi:hypothetical protein